MFLYTIGASLLKYLKCKKKLHLTLFVEDELSGVTERYILFVLHFSVLLLILLSVYKLACWPFVA